MWTAKYFPLVSQIIQFTVSFGYFFSTTVHLKHFFYTHFTLLFDLDNIKWILITLILTKGTKSKQTYRYDTMAKANHNWLRQINDGLILHIDFHHIIKNPDLVILLEHGHILEHRHTHTSLPVPSYDTAYIFIQRRTEVFHSFSVPVSRNGVLFQSVSLQAKHRRALPGTGSCF